MLLKYLMFTISLAASAISVPYEYPVPPVTKPEVSLEKCQTEIALVKQPIVTSCNAGKVEEVKSHLYRVQKPVNTLSITFNTHSSLTIEKDVYTKYSVQFIKVLIKFQSVLTVIYKYPNIKYGCNEVFAKFDYHFDIISTKLKKHGVEIYKKIYAESSFDWTIWESSGFKFYKKEGYSSSGTIGH
ncbi:hypothetical protein PCANC_05342 [Puccinia coronata f. sp. avenae]|uniref:Uncharacterized protein n=1 Tax=Puccinia coronata f. sp. avenae TaxID=200324 RepID=A0A2N5S1Y9_9BASI|nr:hypothetical protein PCASD_25670 [Puccinia coronata f. sp. avenae]PLW09140.1 hypothetical protein PCANC_23967 [Puccinia coronata f. sp. avenae]PLW43779.1 hypothetical protein PCASD_09379 [Puccinia coronata f. sp. avenae]PLW54608.1 hypothetical protein PCANC_05342 [Puccinia coronata f. sp. avenae]